MDPGSIYFYMHCKVHFGRGSLENHLHEVSQYGCKALLVTGKRFAFETGLTAKIINLLARHGVECVSYPHVNPEPSVEDAENGAEFCLEQACDCIVAAGGGSAMDVGKAIAVLARNPGSLKDYFGEHVYNNSPLPVIAVPTTCGTGSEVTKYAVLVDQREQTKKTVASESIIPVLSILDADLLSTLSPRLAVATGMDALAHSAESFLSRKADYLSRLFALDSVRILCSCLPQIKDHPDNLQIREKIFLASTIAGLALNRTGTIILHGIGYSLTIKHSIHHGTANGLLLPYVFQYLKENHYEREIKELEKYWGDTGNLAEFIKTLGLPARLSDIGVQKDELEELADLSVLGTQRAVKNMKIKMDKADFKRILENSF